jgi:hypothetical protein
MKIIVEAIITSTVRLENSFLYVSLVGMITMTSRKFARVLTLLAYNVEVSSLNLG